MAGHAEGQRERGGGGDYSPLWLGGCDPASLRSSRGGWGSPCIAWLERQAETMRAHVLDHGTNRCMTRPLRPLSVGAADYRCDSPPAPRPWPAGYLRELPPCPTLMG